MPLYFLSLVLVWLVGGCSPSAPHIKEAYSTASASVTPGPEDISVVALDQFAERLKKALDEKDSRTVAELTDESAFVHRASRSIGDTQIRAEVEQQANDASHRPLSILSQPGYLRWSLIQTWVSGGVGHVLLNGESDTEEGYVECLVESSGGHLQLVDIVLDLRSQPFSHDMSSFIAAAAAQKDDTRTRIAKFNQLVDKEKYTEALEVYKTLAPSIRKNPLMAVSAISIAGAKSNEAYANALNDYVSTLPPGTPTNALHIKAHYFSGRYTEMIAAIRQIKSRIKIEDSRLDYVEALALTRTGHYPAGQELLLSTLEREPDSEDAKWGLMKLAMLAGDHEEGAVWLDRILVDTPDLPALIQQREDCQAFLKSAVGRAWLKRAEVKG